MGKKLDFEEVKQYFEDHNCELYETEYINNQTPMRYRCDCGNKEVSYISFGNFQQGRRCKKCGRKRQADKRKLEFKDVKQYFEDRNCELKETEYIDCKTKMRYRCNCGNPNCKITFDHFSIGQRCMECSGHKKHTLEEVKQYFEDHNCKLKAKEYINNSTPMEYECICGNDECKICFNSFKNGSRCERCGIKKQKQTMLKRYGTTSPIHCGYSKDSQK